MEETTMQKNIVLEINNTEIHFTVDVDAYNKFVNEMQPTSKVAPATNFLMRTVDDEDKSALRDLLKLPGAAVQIVGDLVQEFVPDLAITVGKSRAPQSE
jgi:hypothetical protein